MKNLLLTFFFLLFLVMSCNTKPEIKIKTELIKKIKNNEYTLDTFCLKKDKFKNIYIYENWFLSNEICSFNEKMLSKKPEYYYLQVNNNLFYPIIKLSFKNLIDKNQLLHCFSNKISERGDYDINFIVNESSILKVVGFPNRFTRSPIYLDSAYFRKVNTFVEVYNY